VSADNDVQRLLLAACARHLPRPARVLEWGDGAGMIHAIRCLDEDRRDSADAGVAIVGDEKTFQAAQAALTDGGDGRGGREIFFVPVAASVDGETELGASHRDYTLSPAALGRSFSLVIVAGAARASCVMIGWLLLDRGGVMMVRRPGDDADCEGILPRTAAVVNVVGPTGAAAFTLVAKDQTVATAIAASVRQTLPAGYRLADAAVPIIVAAKPTRASQSNRPAPSCVFVNTYYPAFLQAHYQRHPELLTASYAQQKARLQATCFGDSDFYSAGLAQAGWVADDVIANCGPLQSAWAREAGIAAPDYLDVLIEQLKRLRPQVIYLQDLSLATTAILSRLRPLAQLLVGQIASPLPPDTDLAGLDIVFTSFPHWPARLRQSGCAAYYQPLAFEPRVLDLPPTESERHSITFVGGISPAHPAGTELLGSLAAALPIAIYGYGAETLPADSRIRGRHLGEAWGEKMFGLLRASAITVNRHIAVAESDANNMRLYEATGCGALLITDHKNNLGELFEIGKEIVAYRTPEECVALCRYYLGHPDEAAAIARAGQARTLRDHTYARRMRDTAEILAGHLRHKGEAAQIQAVDLGAVSTGQTPIAAAAVTTALTEAWKDESLPGKQRALVERELAAMYQGGSITPFDVLANALRPLLTRHPSAAVLEIGCASGYYREVLRYLLGRPINYTGVDYSPAMIDLARDYYPAGNFSVADGARLPFADQSFAVVISSCVLLHVPNYQQHIRETTRVAGDVIVVHRTPICRTRPTHHLRKKGYGVDMVELCFNEGELLALFAEGGFTVTSQQEFHADAARDEYGVTYVCQRAGKELF
jgi:SAM-dependent methyltransferase